MRTAWELGAADELVGLRRWLHMSPVIGGVKLDRLAPADVRHLLAELIKAEVGNTTVRQAHGLLRNALGDAERLELVPRNVAKSVRPPASTKGRVRALTRKRREGCWRRRRTSGCTACSCSRSPPACGAGSCWGSAGRT